MTEQKTSRRFHGAPIENPQAYARAVKARIIANANKTWRDNTPDWADIEAFVRMGCEHDDEGNFTGYADNFLGSMASSLDNYGKLTPKQCDAIRNGIAKRKARQAEWDDQRAKLNASREHVGAVGDKLTMALTLKKSIELDSHFGVTFINILEDANRNVIIYKGNADAVMRMDEGDTLELTFTVKEHGVRDGVKQTVIQRPKLTK